MTDNERIIERYNQRIDQYGSSIQALASGAESRRQKRFEILFECGISKGDSILDLGCGFGDLYSFLNMKLGVCEFKYTGIDINKRIIEEAKKKHPKANFKVADILEQEFEIDYDYIVSTSSFNLRLIDTDNYAFIDNIIAKCYKISKKGVAIDFLSTYVEYKLDEKEFFYYSPERIFSIAKTHTKRVCLRHDYPLFEFCLYLFKDFKGWKKKRK